MRVAASDIVSAVAAIATIAALIVVSYQTVLTRKAVEASQESLDLTRESLAAARESMAATKQSTDLAIRTMQIKMLPKANWIITVRVKLEEWLRDLNETATAVADAVTSESADAVKLVASRGLRSPQGLVSTNAIEHMPEWLTTIWFAGAQHYYNAKCNQAFLWSDDSGPQLSFAPDFISLCRESAGWIQDLLDMLHDVVPRAYMESPQRLGEDRFLDGPWLTRRFLSVTLSPWDS